MRRPARPRSRLRRLWDWLLTFAILGLLILLAARLDRTETRSLAGRVTVNDGDSITLGTERIRLRGIDAPEFDQTCRKDGADYPCGRRAREALVARIGGRPVSCTGWERDKYDRLLATCTAGGSDLNRGQVEAGWAIAYGGYEAEEAAARQKGEGSGPAPSTARTIGARCMAGWPKSNTPRRAKSSTGCARCFDFPDAGAICRNT